MKTAIEGGWVVAFGKEGHEVFQNGTVVYENDRVVHAGGEFAGEVDARIDARGMLVSPGFINTHIHPVGNGGDYLLMDNIKNDYRTANYLSFSAPLKGKFAPPAPENMAALRLFVLLHALRHGSTTIIDVGGFPGEWETYARQIESVGLRVYAGPAFRDRNTFTDEQGRIYYEENAEAGRQGLEKAAAFIREFDGAADGLLRGIMLPAQVETCTEPLLRAAKEQAQKLDVPVHTHAGGNLLEFQRILQEYRKTPIAFLADIGFLDSRTLLGHAVFTTAHPWTLYPFGDDLRLLAESGATVGHCPYKYVKMAIILRSLEQYLQAGIPMAIGTDSYPMDMVSEMRWASMLAKVADGNYQAGRPRDVFNAATLGGCGFLARDELGRLAPGSKADIVMIRLEHMGTGAFRDPIKALVEYGAGRDVDTVIVNGKTLIEKGAAINLDEEKIYNEACRAVEGYWANVPNWHWAGQDVDSMIPPAFPIHEAAAANH
ncbi:MAG: chlorohydrolase family protein [SAR324 cluster bacterium]|nr:chlorohydrolase family protein [SAR324 cluster bacterium]